VGLLFTTRLHGRTRPYAVLLRAGLDGCGTRQPHMATRANTLAIETRVSLPTATLAFDARALHQRVWMLESQSANGASSRRSD
jgi:hypothetical protein